MAQVSDIPIDPDDDEPPAAVPMSRSIREAEIELMAYFGGRLGSPLVVHEIDKAIIMIAQLREIAADIHGRKPHS